MAQRVTGSAASAEPSTRGLHSGRRKATTKCSSIALPKPGTVRKAENHAKVHNPTAASVGLAAHLTSYQRKSRSAQLYPAVYFLAAKL